MNTYAWLVVGAVMIGIPNAALLCVSYSKECMCERVTLMKDLDQLREDKFVFSAADTTAWHSTGADESE